MRKQRVRADIRTLKKVLIVRTDRIGDVVLSLPVAAALRRANPHLTITMMVQPYVRNLVENHDAVDEVLLDEGIPGLSGLFRMVKWIRKGRYDAALLLHPTPRLALIAFLASIPLRIGTAYRFYSLLFNIRIHEHRKVSLRHEAEYNLTLAGAIGADPDHVELSLPADKAAARSLDRKLSALGLHDRQRFVILHPGSLRSALDWPLGRFTQLAKQLAKGANRSILVTGSAVETESAEIVSRAAGEKGFALAGKLDLSELTELLRRADLLIANSTGPLHMAVAAGSEVIGLFPPVRSMSPRRWGPYGRQESTLVPEGVCPKCTKEKCRRFNCMDEISVESVYTLAVRKLSMNED